MYFCIKMIFYSSLLMSYIREMGLQMSLYIHKQKSSCCLVWKFQNSLKLIFWQWEPDIGASLFTHDRIKKKKITEATYYRGVQINLLLIVSLLRGTLLSRSTRWSLRPAMGVPVLAHWVQLQILSLFPLEEQLLPTTEAVSKQIPFHFFSLVSSKS